MKSLKRTLSLVLALVMVLGLFGGLTASASNFTDDDDIQYKEAVDVMTAIGAIDGRDDGTFDPKNTITRAEAAKLVTYAVLGKDTAAGLTGLTTNFTDVTKEAHGYAIPSIEYLVKQGVIHGRDETTFDPDGKITGYEIAKMLLCAIGYGKRDEYVGDAWTLQVAIDGNKYNIFDDRVANSADLSEPATREEVALYCLNAIQEPMVEYLSYIDVYQAAGSTIKDLIYPTLNKTEPLNDDAKVDGTTGKTALGEPANVWTYKGNSIGAYAEKAAFTYTTTKKESDLKAELKNVKFIAYNVAGATYLKPTENGDMPAAATAAAGVLDPTNAITTIKDLTGNGYVVKVFTDDKGQVTAVTQVKNDIAVVAANNRTGVTLNVTSHTKASASAGAIAAYTIAPTSSLYSKVSGLEVGEKVVVTPVKPTGSNYTATSIADVYVPEKITGTITKLDHIKGVYTIGDKDYALAACASSDTLDVNAKDEVNAWLDQFGNIVDCALVEENSEYESNVVLVLDGYSQADAEDNNLVKYYLTGYFTDGSEAKLTVSKNDYDDVMTNINSVNLYTYSTNSTTGISKLDEAETGALADTTAAAKGSDAAAGKVIKLKAEGQIKSTDVRLNGYMNGNDSETDPSKALNDATNSKWYTNYYAPDVTFVNIKQKSAANDEITVKTGVQSWTIGSGTPRAFAVVEKDVAANKNVVTMVFTVDSTIGSTVDVDSIAYIGELDTPTTTLGVAGTTTNVYIYNAFVNGEQREIKTLNKSGTLTAGGFYKMAESTKLEGVYVLTALADAKYEEGATLNKAYGTTMSVTKADTSTADLSIADAKIVDTRVEENTGDADQASFISEMTAAQLVEYVTKSYKDLDISYVLNDKGAVTTIYINSVPEAKKLYKVTLNQSTVTVGKNTYKIEADTAYQAKDDFVVLKIAVVGTSDTTNTNEPMVFMVNGAVLTYADKDSGSWAAAATGSAEWTPASGTLTIKDKVHTAAKPETLSFKMGAAPAIIEVTAGTAS